MTRLCHQILSKFNVINVMILDKPCTAGCEASESPKRWFLQGKTTFFTKFPKKSANKVGPGKSISYSLMSLKKGFLKIHVSNSACSVARAPTSFPPPQNSREIRTHRQTNRQRIQLSRTDYKGASHNKICVGSEMK